MRLGELIRPLRAGDGGLAISRIACPRTMTLRSDSFPDGGSMPSRFSVEGNGVAPGLSWDGVPPGTAELALVVQDPDAPLLRPIVHAIVTGIAPEAAGLTQGAWERTGAFGLNSFFKRGFIAPAPIPAHGAHRYIFQLFALDRRPNLPRATLLGLLRASRGHALACGVLVGLYERS